MSTQKNPTPIWFKGTMPENWVTRYTVGNDNVWDTMLLPYDVAATRAHVLGLVRATVMTEEESADVDKALDGLLRVWRAGESDVSVSDEDCHTVIERWLIEHTGSAGKKVHTGRSRNDQVLAALRLWMRDQVDDVRLKMCGLIEYLLEIAAAEAKTFLPGYTHMRRAMPSTIGLWAAGFAESLCDDLGYVVEARSHANTSPLGSAAGYGVPYLQLDRRYVAGLLGFEQIQENVTAVQLSRGKLELGVVHALIQVASTINRLSSDFVLYSTSEFDFIRFENVLTTGSSIMPQKNNIDAAELARATLHRISAEAQILVTTPSNLPSGYHRDLQITKEAVMRSLLSANDLLDATRELLSGLIVNTELLEKAKSQELFATAAALARVSEGESFRDAYQYSARNPGSWEREMETPLDEAYRYTGTPGAPEIEAIRARLRSLELR